MRLHLTHILGISQFEVPILLGFSSNSPSFLAWFGRSREALHLIALSFLQLKSERNGHQVWFVKVLAVILRFVVVVVVVVVVESFL